MPSYTAPLEDMMFLFEKLRDNKNYNELEKYKEVSSDLVKDILEEAAKINQNLILPLAKAGDENCDCIPTPCPCNDAEDCGGACPDLEPGESCECINSKCIF